MKKVFISLAVLTGFITNHANAQKGFSLSVKATPQFSFLQNKDDINNNIYDNKATFNTNFGLGGNYNFTNKLGIGMDVLYSLQGQKYTLNGIEYNQKNDYVKVPLYFTYVSNPVKSISFIGKVGPQVSFITNSKLEDRDGHSVNGDTKNKYTSATFGGAAVAGIQLKLKSSLYLTTAARFDYDFTNAEDNTYMEYVNGRAKTYNITTGIEVGLKFNLK